MSNSLRPHELQHARLFCPLPSPWVCSYSCPLNQWCHPTISSSVAPISCYPATLNLSQHQGLFQWVSSLHQVTKVFQVFIHKDIKWALIFEKNHTNTKKWVKEAVHNKAGPSLRKICHKLFPMSYTLRPMWFLTITPWLSSQHNRLQTIGSSFPSLLWNKAERQAHADWEAEKCLTANFVSQALWSYDKGDSVK